MHGPALMDGLDHFNLVCVDDIQTVVGNTAWEQELFNFFNRIQENGNRLIISALTPPNQTDIHLPDLKSRLCSGLTLKLYRFQDEDKLAALQLRASALGFDLPPRVGRYLLAHYRRDLPSLWNLLDRLDYATLAAKRRLTIPFIKRYLDLNP